MDFMSCIKRYVRRESTTKARGIVKYRRGIKLVSLAAQTVIRGIFIFANLFPKMHLIFL